MERPALRRLREAAEQGDADAQYSLGLIYANGQGVPRDHAEAAKWYRKAAEQGHAKAQYRLGFMYEYGVGVPRDLVLAHMWSNLAATHLEPGIDRDTAVNNRERAAKSMTPAQIAKAQRLAQEWRPER